MPYASNDGVRIRYDVVGSGPPLVLHSGVVGGVADWADDGYVAALQDRYQLVLLDPRGQGQSDKPHDPAAYTRRHRVGDVLAILDAEEIGQAHFWGYSMGGAIGFALGAHAPHRLRSLVLGGAHPFEGNPQSPEGDVWLDGLQQGMVTLVREWEVDSPEFWQLPARRERWYAADTDALAAAWRQRLAEPDLTEAVVAAIPVPTLLYAGTLDEPEETARTARLMANATFVALDGLDHLQAYFRRDVVLPHVLQFLSRVEDAEVKQL